MKFGVYTFVFITILLLSCGGNNETTTTEPPISTVSSFGLDQVFESPKWQGEYRVATTAYQWQDNSRGEPHSEDTNDFREVHARLFYPTDALTSDNKLILIPEDFWLREGSIEAIPEKELRKSNYTNVTWDIEIDAPISHDKSTYPLIIFSNGFGLSPEMHVTIAAELASHGFIVASLNHPYGSGTTKLLNGNTVNNGLLPEDNLGVDLPLWSDDQIFTLNQLQDMNLIESSMFYSKIDQRIGVMGHSYGGAAAFYSAAQDNRVLAVINLDGTIFNSEDKTIDQPFMYMQNNSGYDHTIFEQVNNDGYAVTFENQITHLSFSDFVLFWQWDFPNNQPFGPMNSQKALFLVSGLSREFFRKYFDGLSAPMLDELESQPEIIKITKF